MPLFDQHTHSRHSFDSATAPRDNVEQALKLGLAGLAFTEHFDTHEDEWGDCLYDDARFSEEIRTLQTEYGDRIRICKGLEVCYQPHKMGQILDFLSTHEFDVVLLSVHWAKGKPVHAPEHFVGVDPEQYVRDYLETVLQATAEVLDLKKNGSQPFNILGHLDFAKRYTARLFGREVHVGSSDLIEEILKNCLAAELVPEVNTSTLRNGMTEPMPGREVIRKYRELGGTAMSLGSDAHSPQCVGSHLAQAAAMLQSEGIERIAVFIEGECCETEMASR